MPATIIRTPRQQRAAAAAEALSRQAPTISADISLPPLLTRQQLAELLHTTADAIAQAQNEGRAWVPPAFKLADRRVIYYKREDVLALLQPVKVAA